MDEGLIRKIIIGRDPKDAMAYYIGMRAGDGKVSAILDDERAFVKYNTRRYLVYIENDERTLLMKAIAHIPTMPAFDTHLTHEHMQEVCR